MGDNDDRIGPKVERHCPYDERQLRVDNRFPGYEICNCCWTCFPAPASDVAKTEGAGMAVRNRFLEMWVVTFNPADFPGKFVVRRWNILPGRSEMTCRHEVADTIEDIRILIPAGLIRFDRDPNDDPVIVETWM